MKSDSFDPESELQILLVDDDPDARKLARGELQAELRGEFEIVEVDGPEAFERALGEGGFSLVITACRLGWSDGSAVLEAVKARHPGCPVIMVTEPDGLEIALEAIRSGLDDYLIKTSGRFAGLGVLARRALDRAREYGALREAVGGLRRLFAGVPLGMFRADPLGRITDANSALVQMLGYSSPESLRGVSITDLFVYPWDQLQWQAMQEGADEILRGFDVQLRRADDSRLWAEINVQAVRDAEGGTVFLEGSVANISSRKQVEEAIHASEEKYRLLFQESRDAIYMSAKDGTILEANRAWLQLFGYSFDDLRRGLSVQGLYENREDRARLLELIEEQGSVIDYEVRLRRSDRAVMDCLLSASARRRADGTTWGYQGIIRDITDRKRLELQLRQSQRLEAIGQLAGGVAHDFNNMLLAILGSADLIGGELGPDHPAAEDLEAIRTTANRAAELTRQLLAFSRQQVLRPASISLNSVIEETRPMLQRLIGTEVELRADLEPNLGAVVADATQITQVLMNLAVNARDAMPEGGSITLRTGNVYLDQAYARSHAQLQPGHYVRLTFSDTGSGMDEQTRSRIFEPFFTTKGAGGGTGLGLSTVYGIIKQSGGYIWVYSEPGRGTTFKIYFPRVDAVAESWKPSPPPLEPTSGSETVLVVDDERAVLTLVSEFLRRAGYTVLEAPSAQEALAIFEERAGAVDVLVTDVALPEVSGVQLAGEIVSRAPQVRIVFISGFAHQDTLPQLGAGVTFLQKPFTPAELTSKVREVLDAGPK